MSGITKCTDCDAELWWRTCISANAKCEDKCGSETKGPARWHRRALGNHRLPRLKMDPETAGCEQTARTAAVNHPSLLRVWPTGWPKRRVHPTARTATRAGGRRLVPGAPPSASRASDGPPPRPGKRQRCSAPRRATPKWRPRRLTAPARPPALALRRARRPLLWQRRPLEPPPWGRATQPAFPPASVPPSWKLRQDGGAGDLSSALSFPRERGGVVTSSRRRRTNPEVRLSLVGVRGRRLR